MTTNMILERILFALVFCSWMVSSATVIPSCPYTISAPGVYTLNTDLSSIGTCVTSTSVTGAVLDCRDHTITGSGTGYGVYLDRAHYFELQNCSISNFSKNAYIYRSENVSVLNNTFFNSTSYGVHVYYYSYNAVLTGNNVFASGATAVYVEYYSHGANVSYNNVSYNKVNYGGIYFDRIRNGTIDNNYLSQNAWANIYAGRASNANLTISNNFLENVSHGIYVYTMDGALITGNLLVGITGTDGIDVYYTTNTTVSNNRVYNSTHASGSGISLRAQAYECNVTNNTVDTAYIGIKTDYSADNRIYNNWVNNTPWSSIMIYRSNNTLVADNQVYSRIYAWTGDNHTILRNNITGSGTSGILLNVVSNSLIIGNNATANGDEGIYLVSSPNTTLTENHACFNNVDDGGYKDIKCSSSSLIAGSNSAYLTSTGCVGLSLYYSCYAMPIQSNDIYDRDEHGIATTFFKLIKDEDITPLLLTVGGACICLVVITREKRDEHETESD